ncbi:ATPase [Prolixibacteraceae bacterium Z1-6]|uniref:ATPase n=1 Tax=Draconibacterium aestuarii TaxID=2998507 RepID=A0A9X3F300_9BACT|nr:ATPase [Prolixibacteraceae bacterium Z1-6]
MLIIADSGSSKTDWLFINGENTYNIQSPGINPFFQNMDEIIGNQKDLINDEFKAAASKLFFYGAGCIKGKTDKTVLDALSQIFPNAQIQVEDDMLGAARALLGNTKGIACILGTGANSCFYNGTKIMDKIPTLGFILGDEGSGAHIGKLFLNDYFKRAIPKDLKAKIDMELQLEMAGVLNSVYREEYPSRYLASFSTFLNKNINHTYTQNLIKKCFAEFFIRNIERYENYKNLQVNFVGSIAYHYSDLLKEVAFERGITVGKIICKPIEGLKRFHTNF